MREITKEELQSWMKRALNAEDANEHLNETITELYKRINELENKKYKLMHEMYGDHVHTGQNAR